ncbi:hypothetical protein P170DRAFT_463409 [Aspergillus steynii IBT 23096]|uniref:Zn(2)-C6 fungal-type domain-containing protein n=1 Tax=Aspergillus steynii IBT 23096 TaxID=1392250 RepID=A0A2I2GB77_9EURO|nr:uncharacterized protein P170DRAFT_463409 [Aspergillus steynii IBT 23096]PLB50139.1 hypothetical protein P170DRAFT_463409 [Aspergillus steynii IBT 23096]
MSTGLPTPEQSTPTTSRSHHPRALACVLCQQRKVKCDRRSPCTNCTKYRTQCVPATQVRRRRRFPERALLDRIRKYESLLRQNNVRFDPLHKDTVAGSNHDSDYEPQEASGADSLSSANPSESRRPHEVKNIWLSMNQGSRDNSNELAIRKAWDQGFDDDDHLLFGTRTTAVNISALHPEPVHIFRLWQIYLDNVNPLLKVIHTPSLQGRIIDAASNVANTDPVFQALIFGIYCTAVLSLPADDCQRVFGSSKQDLLAKFQFGCQQALSNYGFLRSSNREALTALYLYLVSSFSVRNPRSLSSMLAVAIRIAQRMGIHNEAALARCTVFEAEMRRRLWWSLMLFDSRINELTEHNVTTLAPAWDCKIPLNVGDSDLRIGMKDPPIAQGPASEALYVVVRSELGEFLRHAPFHLDFTHPALKPIAKELPGGGDMAALEKIIEEKYLVACDPENPLHFMTIWMTRGHLARSYLVEHYSRCSSSSSRPGDAQRDAAMSHALSMLECDTKIMTSPLTQGFLWSLHFNFPFFAYIYIIQDLKERPISKQAERAWEVMSDNYEARFSALDLVGNPLFQAFGKIVLPAWEAFEASFKRSGEPLPPPRIVSGIRQKFTGMPRDTAAPGTAMTNVDTNDSFTMPMGPSDHNLLSTMGSQDYLSPMSLFLGIPGQNTLPGDTMDQFSWASMEWAFGQHGS